MKQVFCVGRLIDWLRVNFGADDWSHQSRPMQTSQALKKEGEKGKGGEEGRMNILKKCEKQNRYEGQRELRVGQVEGWVRCRRRKLNQKRERESRKPRQKHRRSPSRPMSSKTTVTPRGARDNNGLSDRTDEKNENRSNRDPSSFQGILKRV